MKRKDYYRGSEAARYEQKRQGTLWDLEQEAARHIVDNMEPGQMVLDVPVGTGRFLPIYEAAGVVATGVDVSPDMLAQAEAKGTGATLKQGDVFHLPLSPSSFDRVVCFRLLNWMELQEVTVALMEMARVARGPLHLSVTTLIGPPREHVARIIHEPDAFLEAVEDAGLGVVETDVLREHRSHRYQVVTVQ